MSDAVNTPLLDIDEKERHGSQVQPQSKPNFHLDIDRVNEINRLTKSNTIFEPFDDESMIPVEA